MKRVIKSASSISENLIKRTKQAVANVMRCYNADTEDFYEEDVGDIVLSEKDEHTGKDWNIYKQCVLYSSNYDENDRRVKKGARVPGSTFYTISYDGDTYDEENFAYSSLDDAKKWLSTYQELEAAKYNKLNKLSNRGGN